MTIYKVLLLTATIIASLPTNNSSTVYYNQVKEVQELYSNKNSDYIYEENIEKEPNLEEPEIEEPSIVNPPIDTPVDTQNIEAPLEYSPIDQNQISKDINLFKNYKLSLMQDIYSEDVLKLKKFMHIKGYTDMPYGYNFDSILKEAVIRYQKDNGLVADGIVGAATFNKINEDMILNGINISERKPYFSSQVPKGQWIFINKSSNTLYFLNSQEVKGKYNVATGKTQLDTPEGKFSIAVKVVNPAWGGAGKYEPVKGGEPNNPLGKRWMGLNIGDGGQYGIHGNAAYYSIGRYISMGCIRMYNEDVEYLFDMVNRGAPVWIGSEHKLQEFGITFQ